MEEKLHWKDLIKFFNFIPVNVTILWMIFLLKFFINILYLKKFYGLRKANSSSATFGLYWVRVTYDLVMIGGALILFAALKKNAVKHHKVEINHLKKYMMGNDFTVFVIIVPLAIFELMIYWLCKLEAE